MIGAHYFGVVADARAGYLGKRHIDAVREAQAKGFIIVRAKQNELQVDWDSEDLTEFKARLDLAQKLGLTQDASAMWNSKSGNWHIIVRLPVRTSTTERLALQAMLGSDWKREMLNLKRWLDGEENPMVLFKPGEQKSRPRC